MQIPRHLFPYPFQNSRMSVTQDLDGYASEKIEILITLRVPEIFTRGSPYFKGIPSVYGNKKLFFLFFYLHSITVFPICTIRAPRFLARRAESTLGIMPAFIVPPAIRDRTSFPVMRLMRRPFPSWTP